MKHKSITSVSAFLLLTVLFLFLPTNTINAMELPPFIALTSYSRTMNIGDQYLLAAVTSNGKKPSFHSSASSIASVNTYGMITAKKAGHCTITVRIRDAEASCSISVQETRIILNKGSASIENNASLQLSAQVSTRHPVVWKSSRPSIAQVDENGLVTAKKPGTTNIFAKADGTTACCQLTVRKPVISLSQDKMVLYRLGIGQLHAAVSSGKAPVWKSNRRSVATVDENGKVTAVKHGTAIITATVDGVKKSCTLIVQQPKVSLSASSLNLVTGQTTGLKAEVSSGNPPQWSVSNPKVLCVDDQGRLTALAPGRSYVYAQEDGIRASCAVRVTAPAK